MARRLRRAGFDPWPGFVDALASLLMVVMFVLLVFVLGQGVLSATLSTRDRALEALRGQITELGRVLALERETGAGLRGELAEARRQDDAARAEVALLTDQVAELRGQIARLAGALEIADAREQEAEAEARLLQARLDAALLARVEELQRYRSEFYGRLRALLGERPEVRVVGDRFVFQSEVLFAPGSAELSAAGRAQVGALSGLLLEVAAQIPESVSWILRVDGHADRTPIRTPRFASNWELSAARAIAVANLLIEAGLPPARVAAAAFGEHQPLDPGDSPEALARNRRIELRLTDR